MKLTVIIPTFNEEKCIEETLKDLFESHVPDEVIIADGGSSDRTVELVRQMGTSTIRLLSIGKGRAKQMNHGAKEATGDIFLFLHADTKLPTGGLEKIKEGIGKGAQAGRFQMRFDSKKWILKLYESYTRFQCFSYGDQGFFIQRDLFEELKGFREDVPFEDLEFYKRLRTIVKPMILKDKVVTSARRFLEVGCLKQKFINMFLVTLYYLGWNVLPAKEKVYQDIR